MKQKCFLVWFHRCTNETDQRSFLLISLGKNDVPVVPGTVPGTAEEVNVLPVCWDARGRRQKERKGLWFCFSAYVGSTFEKKNICLNKQCQ